MKVAVPAEAVPGERRVALLPDVVPSLVRAGLEVVVQRHAGLHALATDEAYTSAGAAVVESVDAADVDVLLHVRPLRPEVVPKLKPGAITLGFCSPSTELATVSALAQAQVTAFAMELVPRISRAQSMDALTSQALVAGYRCVLEAAMRLPRFFPLFMTAAGTIPPAKVLVLGAGVAGLQAIATAKRLGAVVSAYDVRPASADEVRSMGATFVDLDLEAVEGAGGYARELSADRAVRQQELLAPHVAGADVLVTTASVPGRRAPVLVTSSMVARMKPGSVVVDLAAESGGNVEGVVAGEDLGRGRRGRHRPARRHEGRAEHHAGRRLPALREERHQPAAAHDQGRRRRPRPRRRGRGGRLPDARRRGSARADRRAARRRPDCRGERLMDGIALLAIFVLAVFVGFEVVSKVSTTLHTPLMSGANAIHGIILVGAIIVTGQAHSGGRVALGLLATVLATVNLVGGFVVTDRMLEMFKGRGRPAVDASQNGRGAR